MEERTATLATVVDDGAFGACSICKNPGGTSPHPYFAKVGKLEFGVCFEHRIFWEIGSNNFSTHWHLTLNQMRTTALKMHGFKLVGSKRVGVGSMRVDEDGIVWPADDAVEAIEEWFDGFFKVALERNPAVTREQLEDMTIDEMLPH